jgi:hypothetical protein
MIAVKDPDKFEKLLARLFNRMTSAAAQFTQTPYRGVTINANKDLAYAMVNGFFIAGGSAAQIHRAVDAQASDNSLASTDEFRSVFNSNQEASLRAYLSPAMSDQLFESLFKETGKSNGSIPLSATTPQARKPIGIQLIPDEDGLMIEARLPANLAILALASIATGTQATSAITSLPSGIGVSEPGPRVSGSSKTPKMTDDDVRRRP